MADLAVRLSGGGRELHCWGREGPQQERRLADSAPAGSLPVLLGAGLGECLAEFARRGPVAVVDREFALQAASGVRERLAGQENILWLDSDAETVLTGLQAWQRHWGRPLHLVRLPLYLRLDPGHYRALADALAPLSAGAGASRAELPAWARHPRFTSVRPRILILRKKYFLYAEIEAALRRLEAPHAFLEVGEGGRMRPGFVEDLLRAVADFRPDFLLTVNHFGLDREGRLAGLLDEARLPLASWFVDSPELVLRGWPGQNRPHIAVFSFDAGSLEFLESQGFQHVAFLPLATDPERFAPGAPGRAEWRSPVSFVGESLTDRVRGLAASLTENGLGARLEALGEGFAGSDCHSPGDYLREQWPQLAAEAAALGPEQLLAADSLVAFAAARHYRLACVRGLAPHPALVAGDAHWPELLEGTNFRVLPRLEYYRDLPGFYACADVNFNCTSAQMKGAVNQRVFDVPACNAFLLTDERDQLSQLFEPGREVACYGAVGEIAEQVRRWLGAPEERKAVAGRARKRVLAQHTYVHRLESLLAAMRAGFAPRLVAD